MIINHNIAALNTNRQLNANNDAASKSLEKLSSGLRINRAGDDAAGLAISEKMRSQIRGLDMASKNAQDSISLIQTAEGAMNEDHSILQRMRELAVQSSNDTNTTADREELQKEVNQLTSEINRIGNTTEFNTKKLLNGDFNANSATAATVTGNKTISTITLSDTAEVFAGVKGNTAASNSDAVDSNSVLTGGVTGQDGTETVDATKNEITVTIDGTTETYAVDAAANTLEDALADLNTHFTGKLEFSLNSDGAVQVKSADNGATAQQFSVDGGNFADTFIGSSTYVEGTAGAWRVGPGADATTTAATAIGTNSTFAAVDDDTNELSFATTDASGNVTTTTIQLASVSGNNYDLTDTASGGGREDFLTDLNTDLASAGITASFDGDKLVFSDSANQSVKVSGGGAASVLGFDETSPTGQVTANKGVPNNTIKISVNGGAANTYTLDSSNYKDLDDLVANLNTKLAADNLQATIDSDGKVSIASTDSAATSVSVESGTLATELGLDTTTPTGHSDAKAADNTLALKVNGTDVNVTLDKDVALTKDDIVSAIQDAMDSAGVDATVSLTSDNKLQISSNATGTAAKIEVVGDSSDELASKLGLNGKLSDTGEQQLTFQIGANQNQSLSLSIGDVRANALGLTGTGDGFSKTANVTNGTDSNNVENALDITTADGAAKAITTIDAAITKVSSERSKLGAVQNRLEHTINNLGTASENLTSAESRIRDVDMAKEMTQFTKNNILTQAAQAMLAQANQQGQGVLQLLR